MAPFSAFFILVAGILAAEEATNEGKPNPVNNAIAAVTAPKNIARGGSYSEQDVLAFQSNPACKDANAASPSDCGNFPLLSTVPGAKADWIDLAKRSVSSFALGFGQTEFGGNNKQGPTALTTSEFFPEILNIGLVPRNKPNVSREFQPTKGYKSVSYDLKICSLGGRIRVKVTDMEPFDEFSKPDTINTTEMACEELQFNTDPSIASNILTQVENGSGKLFNLSSKGQVSRTIQGKRYAGSVLNLNQDLDLAGESPLLRYNDGAIGYCVGSDASANNWEQQCLKTGVVMDGFKLSKTFHSNKVEFPGVSYIALSLAAGTDAANKPLNAKYEMVGRDLEIAKGASVPTNGILTIVGHAGEKVRVIFKGKEVQVLRIDGTGRVADTIEMPAISLISK